MKNISNIVRIMVEKHNWSQEYAEDMLYWARLEYANRWWDGDVGFNSIMREYFELGNEYMWELYDFEEKDLKERDNGVKY